MNKQALAVILLILVTIMTIGCGSGSSSSSAARAYSGTASVGDFLSITLDPTAQTITYTNYSNGDSGVVPYTLNSDGTYTLNDPTGNLIAAYEVPNYGLLIQAAKAGPNHATPALITAIQQAPISISSMAGHQYNYMQFRTTAGGLEVGSVATDSQGNITTSSYWPYGEMGMGGPPDPFGSSTFLGSDIQADPSGNFLKLMADPGQYSYIFGTSNGLFAVDTPNGAILGFQKATSPAFDPSYAGTYQAIYYQKNNASTGQGNVETGTPNLGTATLTIGSSGQLTVQNAQGTTLLQATLSPIASASYLYGSASELQDPCYGMFTVRVTNGSYNQDIFATFVGQAVLFSSFTPISSSNYNYLYGVGLK